MAIGNGMHTLFWLHQWADSRPLVDYAVQEISDESLGVTVAEMWEGSD